MNEVAWLVCEDPEPMLWYLVGNASDRKFRLFTVACCRRVWHLIEPHDPIRACVEFAEGYADGVGAKKRLKKLVDKNRRQFERYGETPQEDIAVAHAAAAARATCELRADAAIIWLCRSVGDAVGHDPSADHPAQLALLRCIFGDPFRPVAIAPRWLTSTVLDLARGIYDERAFDRLPILADALEEAGCDHADVLAHCRSDGPHVRGCWVVDLVLGKA